MARHNQKNSSPLLHALDTKTGNIVHIKDISSKHTHLICPSDNCQWPVSPVIKTTRTIKFFRHKPDGTGKDRECKDPQGADENIVHKLAKEVILKRKNMFLFGYSHIFNRYKNKYIKPLVIGRFSCKPTKVHFTDLESEVRRTAKDYQPDITALFENEEFIIEIHYMHLVDQEKLEKIIRDDIPAVEISLSHFKNEEISAYEIDRALINPNNFKWLHYPNRWLTAMDLSEIAQHEATEKKRIDDEIEHQRKLVEQYEFEIAKQQEQYEKEQTRANAKRYEYFLEEYVQEYLEYLLEDLKISPFSKKERDDLKTIFSHIERANSLLNHHVNNAGIFLSDIPAVEDYKRIMKRIGRDHRKKLAKNILKMITHRDEWITNHLISLYELGWSTGGSLKRLVNFNEDEIIKLSDDEFLPIKNYLNNTLLPDCKDILKNYIKGSLP